MKALLSPVLAMAIASVSHAALINDGSTIANLVQLNSGTATDANITSDGSILTAQTKNHPAPNTAVNVKTLWYSNTQPGTTTYNVSADFKPSSNSNSRRGGVMGWFDTSTFEGIALWIRPNTSGGKPEFRIRKHNLSSASGIFNSDAVNESFIGIFTTTGVAATAADVAMTTTTTNYSATSFATVQLDFVAPTAEDLLALPTATARFTATVIQNNTTLATTTLLTTLAAPSNANHVVGYFGYASGSGNTALTTFGTFDNLTLSVVPEPASLSLLGLGGAALIGRRRR